MLTLGTNILLRSIPRSQLLLHVQGEDDSMYRCICLCRSFTFTGTECTRAVARGLGRRRVGSKCLMGTEIQFCKTKINSVDRWW